MAVRVQIGICYSKALYQEIASQKFLFDEALESYSKLLFRTMICKMDNPDTINYVFEFKFNTFNDDWSERASLEANLPWIVDMSFVLFVTDLIDGINSDKILEIQKEIVDQFERPYSSISYAGFKQTMDFLNYHINKGE